MIAELVENVKLPCKEDNNRNGEPEDALPRTGYEWQGPSGTSQTRTTGKLRERTFAMDP